MSQTEGAVSLRPQDAPNASSNLRKSLRVKRKPTVQSALSGGILHLLLLAGSVVMAGPFVWMALSGLKDLSQIFLVPPKLFPDPWVWSNIERSLKALPFDKAYFNSFYISFLVVFCQLITCSMAAFAFAKIKFPFRNLIFIGFLATMMVPGQVTIIPLYLIMKQLGWVDTHLALIVPGALFNAFGVFLLRQFFLSIPNELVEAAVVDGASMPRIYFQILLPLIRPAIAALGIISFLGNWNNFFGPMIFLNTPEKFTVPLLLNTFKGLYITDWTLLMTGSTIAVIPVLVIYILGQRYIIEGVTLTGIKG